MLLSSLDRQPKIKYQQYTSKLKAFLETVLEADTKKQGSFYQKRTSVKTPGLFSTFDRFSDPKIDWLKFNLKIFVT